MLNMLGSIIKQIVMPIITPFLSAFIGYFVAIKIFEKQEKTKGAINKVNNANELFIKAMFIHINFVLFYNPQ
ncbi:MULTISPECIES: hypothetical protein [unclassified Arsenophonus]|uniref:hypothetical protein n=1 Tax=unclassified Arsenophonus TaxID=2627083 RepID=UPI0028646A04|nr:hypothetical protein [Arsenophonus sp.]MDR5610801.1 hypothetical protein [Arsenophonus sp.]MDR5614741.1 hypothetical protein [Arsenophonus sp.]